MANKLELNWAGKHDGYALIRDEETGKPVQVPYDEVQPRLLIEAGRYGDETTDNILISGENLYALKTLVKSGYAGKIKCIYIDPPYNTGNAFAHYDDALEHSLWLDMMRDRVELLNDLLADDGSFWISIDDEEGHYLKVLCDEVFGRENFVANVVWQKRTSPDIRATLGAGHDHIIVFARDIAQFKQALNKLPKTAEQIAQYKNPDNDPRGVWVSSDYTAQGFRPNQMYKITTPSGAEYYPPEGTCWKNIESVFLQLVAEGRIWFGRDGSNMPRRKTYLSESEGNTAWTWWPNTEVGHNQESKKEINELFGKADAFDTPKPERLLQRIIHLATQPGDIVLDCFAGSGTTGAVALKMNRRFIMVEAGTHCETHIIPRLRKVTEGTDQGGISPIVPPHPSRANTDANLIGETKQQLGWTGGGGFSYYTLGKSLIESDAETGVWRLNYTNGYLIEALCLQEGFKLLGRGNYHGVRGRHYAHIADAIVTQDYVDALAAELAEEESLTIYCTKAKRKLTMSDAVQLKRIPRDLLQTTPRRSTKQTEAATA